MQFRSIAVVFRKPKGWVWLGFGAEVSVAVCCASGCETKAEPLHSVPSSQRKSSVSVPASAIPAPPTLPGRSLVEEHENVTRLCVSKLGEVGFDYCLEKRARRWFGPSDCEIPTARSRTLDGVLRAATLHEAAQPATSTVSRETKEHEADPIEPAWRLTIHLEGGSRRELTVGKPHPAGRWARLDGSLQQLRGFPESLWREEPNRWCTDVPVSAIEPIAEHEQALRGEVTDAFLDTDLARYWFARLSSVENNRAKPCGEALGSLSLDAEQREQSLCNGENQLATELLRRCPVRLEIDASTIEGADALQLSRASWLEGHVLLDDYRVLLNWRGAEARPIDAVGSSLCAASARSGVSWRVPEEVETKEGVKLELAVVLAGVPTASCDAEGKLVLGRVVAFRTSPEASWHLIDPWKAGTECEAGTKSLERARERHNQGARLRPQQQNARQQ